MQLKTLAPVELTVIGFTGFVLNIFLVTTRCLKNEELWGLIRRKKNDGILRHEFMFTR